MKRATVAVLISALAIFSAAASTSAGTPGFAVLMREAMRAGLARKSTSAAKARPLTQKSEVEISVVQKRVDNPSLQGLTLVFVLSIDNPSAAVQSLVRYDYRVVIGQTEYLRLETPLDAPIPIPARSEAKIAVPVKFTYEYLYANVPEAQGLDRVECNLVGGMTFQDERRREKRIPFAFTGDFPIYRGFDVKCLPFTAKDLTMGGADIVFSAALVNPNGAAIKPERVTYKISIAGKAVAEGTMGNIGEIAPRGEAPISISLLLDFWEIGKEVFLALDSPPAAVRFQGEIEASWDWGSIIIPFDRTDRVAVKKASGSGPVQNQ